MPNQEPVCPGWLDATAKRYWAELAERLRDAGLLSAQYGEMLARLCVLLGYSEQIARQLQRDGLEVQTGRGAARPHPLLREYRQLVKAASDLGARFGLTPSDLARLDVPRREDELDEFLFGGGR